MATKIPLIFFRTSSGTEPVRDWLKDLTAEDRKIVGQDLQRIQYRWPVGMPIARVIFCFHDNELVALSGFIKKSQKTPQSELDLALDRKKELEQ
ncbi:MAG: type II toxin-antitoxin system RelE/ParE family toxin [Rhodomicrobium sp.]